MARYVTLPAEGDDGFPVTETWPDADRDEVAGSVHEEYPEIVPVLIPEVVSVNETTTTKTGTVTEKTYDMTTTNMIPDPSGATEETGQMLERVTDPGGHLCVYAGAKLLKQYEAGQWKSCAAEPPSWLGKAGA